MSRTKLIALLLGTSFVALLLACAAFVYYDRVTYAQAKRGTLSVLVASVAQSAYGPTAFQDPESTAVILKVLDAEPTAQVGAIYTDHGALLSSWQRPGARTKLPKALSGKQPPSGYDRGQLRLTHAIRGDQVVGTLVVVFSTDDIDQRTARFLQIAAAVLAFAVLLALVIASLAQRVFTRPVQILSAAAHRVQEHKDFDVRALRVSDDELGELTDAFNAMLSMIQARDSELEQHRAGLEATVLARTRDLDQRNAEMRLVLNNVDQGLTMIDRQGVPTGERSAMFDRWFGRPEGAITLGALAEKGSPKFVAQFALQWEQLLEGVLPLELNLAQLPNQLVTREGRHYALSYRPIGTEPEQLEKLLVIVTDTTEQVEKMRSDAEQSQLIALFEQISRDRSGFESFLRETEDMLAQLSLEEPVGRVQLLRALHTLKGNFGLFGLGALASLVHGIEDECLESGAEPCADRLLELVSGWQQLAQRARTLLFDSASSHGVERAALEQLLSALLRGEGLGRFVPTHSAADRGAGPAQAHPHGRQSAHARGAPR